MDGVLGLGAGSRFMPDLDRLEIVRATTLAMANARTSEEVYEQALEGLARGLGASRASVLFFDPDGVMRFKAWRGISSAYRAAVEGHTPWRPHEVGAVPLLVSDVTEEPSLSAYLPTIRAEGIGAMAMIPLVVGGGVIGKFMLYADGPRVYEPPEIQLAQAIAAVTAFAIDRQRAASALEVERRLFMGGPTVVFTWRNQAGWPVDYVSPNLSSQFGYAPEALTSGAVPYASLIHPDDVERVGREVADALTAATPYFEQQYRLRRADGVHRTIYDFTVMERRNGEVTHFHGYVLDVTERQNAEAALRTAERRLAEVQRLESLGLLAGGIAHDFNNLLVGVLGNVGLALGELPADSPARATIETIRLAGTRAAELTRQLLAYSGKGKFVVEPVDLAALVRESGQLLSSSLSRHAQVNYELGAELPHVEADATQIRQVVMNLLTNASDALEGRPGTISVRLRSEEVGGADDLAAGHYVVIEVEDDGAGMDEATRARIFEPFFTTKFHGRGLGMAAVLGVAKGHRGTIRIESTVGRGTKMAFYLPARTDVAPGAGPHAAKNPLPEGVAARPTPGGVVLVVDDEKLIRNLTARVLVGEGFEVFEAENGAVAIERLTAAPVDVVLLDLTMPVMSGDVTLRLIRQRWPAVRVIMSSGYNAESASSVRDADAFIQKPYMAEDLVALVRAQLAR